MRERRGRIGALFAWWVVAVLALSSCSDGGDGDDASSEAATPTTVPAGQESGCIPNGSTVAREGTPTPDAVLLTDVTVSEEGFCDIVRFEFEPTGADLPPNYTAAYEPGPFTEFGDDEEANIGGDAFLVIRFEDAWGVDFRDPEGPATFTGNTEIEPSDLNFLQEARQLADFNGGMEWVIGVSSERPFVVDGAASPSRIIVTIG